MPAPTRKYSISTRLRHVTVELTSLAKAKQPAGVRISNVKTAPSTESHRRPASHSAWLNETAKASPPDNRFACNANAGMAVRSG